MKFLPTREQAIYELRCMRPLGSFVPGTVPMAEWDRRVELVSIIEKGTLDHLYCAQRNALIPAAAKMASASFTVEETTPWAALFLASMDFLWRNRPRGPAKH